MKIKICRRPFIIWKIDLPKEEPSLDYLSDYLKMCNQEFYECLPREVTDYCEGINPNNVYTNGLIPIYYDARISSLIESVELVLVTSPDWGSPSQWYIDLAFRIKGLDSIYHISEFTTALKRLKIIEGF